MSSLPPLSPYRLPPAEDLATKLDPTFEKEIGIIMDFFARKMNENPGYKTYCFNLQDRLRIAVHCAIDDRIAKQKGYKVKSTTHKSPNGGTHTQFKIINKHLQSSAKFTCKAIIPGVCNSYDFHNDDFSF